MNQIISEPRFPKMQRGQGHKHHDHSIKERFFMIKKKYVSKIRRYMQRGRDNTKKYVTQFTGGGMSFSGLLSNTWIPLGLLLWGLGHHTVTTLSGKHILAMNGVLYTGLLITWTVSRPSNFSKEIISSNGIWISNSFLDLLPAPHHSFLLHLGLSISSLIL